MKKPEEVSKALKTLNLNGKITLKDLENAYRKFAVKYHPDRCANKKKPICRKKFIEINNARKILENYLIGGYKPEYRVSKKAIRKYRKHTREYQEHVERFYNDWFGLG
ncbi:MAG: hypothetical protein AUJ85_04740 [Elusimicrobia bacterium CG1_02_37_114]|nr:MAG: hypothetical protein AUJ85_04740 [Elusimicrobia bacterium CG1_02_37_114]PIV53921.1 MAG: hypothetical protein COS17_01385 [Elusimicrobia bacterium CG02_land_8_20_14_3_00_37_13]PIZ13084.1 MAG: hypothetical protein COY53_06710 [Elusimicrobia bacterium CG_4_10_14_0_8_um_filter_37_32]